MKIKVYYYKEQSKSYYINGGVLHISDNTVSLKYFWKTVFEFDRNYVHYEIGTKELYYPVKISCGDKCYELFLGKKGFRTFSEFMES